ncbi:phosphotransferase [Paraburkholderia sp. BR13439]|uniref:phosphotransferase n=1 Tax=unclassified Paraburkholderia TaxID=2615204 RepID=UPI0034D01A73
MNAPISMMIEPLSANSLLMQSAAPVSEKVAEELVTSHYDIRGRVTRLSGERDQNFLIKDPQGQKFLLKISHPAEDPAVTDLQVSVLLHPARKDPSLPVQHVIPSVENNAIEYAELNDGSKRSMRLVSFVDGMLLKDAKPSVALHRNLGRMLARIGLALRDFEHPAAFHPLSWDIQHATSLVEFLPRVKDGALRSSLESVFDKFATVIAPSMGNFRRQVVHNDFSADNVLVFAGDNSEVSGVLDFGDMAHTPLINDVAVAAAYLLGDSEDLLNDAAVLVGGYHEVNPLLKDELALLYDLVTTRMAVRIAITEWRAIEFPENAEYILRNTPRSCLQLNRLLSLDQFRAQHELIRFCHTE